MARKLTGVEAQVLQEADREMDTPAVEINPDNFLRLLKERQQAELCLSPVALWLNKDPFEAR